MKYQRGLSLLCSHIGAAVGKQPTLFISGDARGLLATVSRGTQTGNLAPGDT